MELVGRGSPCLTNRGSRQPLAFAFTMGTGDSLLPCFVGALSPAAAAPLGVSENQAGMNQQHSRNWWQRLDPMIALLLLLLVLGIFAVLVAAPWRIKSDEREQPPTIDAPTNR